jgi:hypothetical protein
MVKRNKCRLDGDRQLSHSRAGSPAESGNEQPEAFQMSFANKFFASIASMVVGIAGLLVLAFGSAAFADETDWHFMAAAHGNTVPVSTDAVAECDWHSPTPC